MFKETNPKDAVGIKKWRQYCTVPQTVIWEMGVAMLEGARKYGRHNYRVAGVRASTYLDAAKGHLDSWWEGEDLDPDTQLSHITKAIVSLAVLRDAMINDMYVDDRPPPMKNFEAFRNEMQERVEEIIARHPDPIPPYTAIGQAEAPGIYKPPSAVEAEFVKDAALAKLQTENFGQFTEVRERKAMSKDTLGY